MSPKTIHHQNSWPIFCRLKWPHFLWPTSSTIMLVTVEAKIWKIAQFKTVLVGEKKKIKKCWFSGKQLGTLLVKKYYIFQESLFLKTILLTIQYRCVCTFHHYLYILQERTLKLFQSSKNFFQSLSVSFTRVSLEKIQTYGPNKICSSIQVQKFEHKIKSIWTYYLLHILAQNGPF